PLMRVDSGFTFDRYSPNAAGRTREWSAFAQAGASLAQLVLTLRYESFHSFGSADGALTPGVVYRASKNGLVGADVSFTTDVPQFRPRWQANLGGEMVFSPQLTGLLAYRHMQFDVGPVDMLMPALRLQLFRGLEAQLGGAVAHNADASVTGAFVGKVTYAHGD